MLPLLLSVGCGSAIDNLLDQQGMDGGQVFDSSSVADGGLPDAGETGGSGGSGASNGSGDGTGADGTGGDGSGGDGTGGDGTGGDGTGGDGSGGDGTGGNETGGDGTGGDGTSGGDNGSGDDGGGNGDPVVVPPENQVPAVMAAGYGGVRVVSRDDGMSWGDRADLGGSPTDEDNTLLRGLAWGNGRWVAVGHYVTVSLDGVVWSDAVLLSESTPCAPMESVAFGKGYFLGACGVRVMKSTDGMSWTQISEVPFSGGVADHPKIAFWDGSFVATDGEGPSFTSTDGTSWSSLDGVTEARVCDGEIADRDDCNGMSWMRPSVWLDSSWGGNIHRSTDGVNLSSPTYTDGAAATPYIFAAGYAAP